MRVMSLSVTEIEHRKIKPITKQLFPLQDKSIKLAKQNQIIKEEIWGYNKHVWIDLIINSQFIESQQTHRKENYME